MKFIKTHPILSGIIFLVIWQTLLIFQGLDLADTGFHLTAFTYIFKAPYSVQYSMSFWLSDVCGYLWMSVWPMGGLFWARIGWVVVITISIVIYFSILKPELGLKKAIFGLIVTSIFILQGGPECLNYDILTILGYAIAIFFLYKGLLKNRTLFITIAGVALGVSVFFKLTNLSSLLFVLVIPFWSYISKKSISALIKQLVVFGLGVVAGVSFIWLLIWKSGHTELFLDNLEFISNMTQDSEASHGFLPLLTSYLSGYLNAIIILSFSILALLLFLNFTKRFNQHSSKKTRIVILLIMAITTTVLMIVFEKPLWSKIRYLFIGLMLLESIALSFYKKVDDQKRLLTFIGILLLLVAPLGSDSGLEKSVFGMWILGPIVLTNISFEIYFKRFQITIEQQNIIQKALITIILVVSVLYAWQNTYFDAGSRTEKLYSIEHPKMKHIFTSKEKARVVNELINKGFPKTEKQVYLLSFIEIPMINYLAEKAPFISTSWPKLYYSSQSFQEKLNEAIKKRNSLPAIIRQKQKTGLNIWPKKQFASNYLDYPSDAVKWLEHGKVFNDFLSKNNYHIVWENEMFQVLISD